MSELDYILAEQREALAYLKDHPDDRGARLWLADWVSEELIVSGAWR